MARYNTVIATSSTATGVATTPQNGQFTTITGSAGTVTLAAPSTCTGQTQGFWNTTGGAAVLSTPSGAINFLTNTGSANYTMANNSVIFLTSDGTNYVVTGTVGAQMVNVNVSGTYTASAQQFLWVNTSSAAFTITLPAAPSQGDTIRIVDITNTFNTNNLTIAPNSLPIMGSVANMTVATQGAAFDMIYYNVTYGWRLFTI
jgi:hypothetical protein